MAEAVAPPLPPFESASELRSQHARLLEALDQAMADGAQAEAAAVRRIEPALREFLERTAATGVYLEAMKERTACQALIDYWVASLAQVGVQAPATRLARFDASQLPDLNDKPCPYVGLEAFRSEEFFFGRAADVAALREQLARSPLLVVLGASGSGKSSLIMGGLLPALAADASARLRVAPIVIPGHHVLRRLAESLLQLAGRDPAEAPAAGEALLAEPARVNALLEPQPPATLVVVDQFEEVFTLDDEAPRVAAAAALAALLEAGRGHRVIVTMREEFRSRLVQLPALAPYLDRAWYSMRPMGYAELREAVERPAAKVNLQFEAGIVDDVVKKVLGQPAALPLLQFTLRELWNRRDRNRITREVYALVGDPLNALRESADGFFEAQAPQTQDEIRRVLLELVRVDELLEAYRQPVPLSQLLGAGRANTREVLLLLAEHDYVRVWADEEDPIVEVKHEALIRNWPRLVGWIDEKRLQRRQRLALTQTAQRWAASGRPREGLLTGWQLQEAARLGDLSELEAEFVRASEQEIDRAQREREAALQREAEEANARARRERAINRRLRIGWAVTAVLLAVNAALFFWQQQRLQDMQRLAEAQRRTAMDLSEAFNLQRLKAADLEKQNEALRRQYDYLDQLFARQLRQAVAPQIAAAHALPPAAAKGGAATATPLAVYIHISDESQRSRAETIRKELAQLGIRAPGVERVPTRLQSTQVRYFRPEDRPGAEEIRRLLGQFLAVGDIRVEFVKGYEDKAGSRQYEIWFGPVAFGAWTAAAPAARQ
jgi:hypothetical protein